MSANRKPKLAESCFTRTYNCLLNWLLRNIAWLIPTIISFILGWMQFNQYVEADLIVTSADIELDTDEQRVYTIDFVINNSGNQSIIVINATPFVQHVSNLEAPPMVLLKSNRPERLKDNVVEAGKIKSFSIHAYLNQSFIEAGHNDQNQYSKEFNRKVAVQLPITIGVRIYGADGKFRVAISAPLNIVYSDGKQTKLGELQKPVSFKYVGKNEQIYWDFDEPTK